MKKTGALIKFGRKEHAESLLKNGVVYCSTIHKLADYPDEEIGDIYERAFEVGNFINSPMSIKNVGEPDSKYKIVAKGNFHFTNSYTSKAKCGNLYCTYFLDASDLEVDINFRLQLHRDPMYEYCVFIWDAQKFQERLKSTIIRDAYSFQSDFVKYSDFKTLKLLQRTPFMKDIKYQHQCEYRFWVKNNRNHEIIFEMGNIEDIAFIIKSSDLPSILVKRVNEPSHLEYFLPNNKKAAITK